LAAKIRKDFREMQIFSERIFQKGGDCRNPGVGGGIGGGGRGEIFFYFFLGEWDFFLWGVDFLGFGWRRIGGNV
jgi:hypothetical protein